MRPRVAAGVVVAAVGPPLRPEQIRTSLVQGRQAAMPAWLAVIGEEGVRNTAGFVRYLSVSVMAAWVT